MGSVTGEATTGDAQPKEDQAPDSLSDRIDRINLISPPSTFFPRVISHHHRFLSWILTGLNWGFLSLLGSVTHSLAARLLLPPLIVGLPFLFVVLHHHSSSTPPDNFPSSKLSASLFHSSNSNLRSSYPKENHPGTGPISKHQSMSQTITA